MAPRKTQTEAQTPSTPAPAPTATASTATKTVQGFAIGLNAFIPVDPKDLRKQAEIPMLLLDIQEGRKGIADLQPYLKQIDFRQQHVRKRVSEAEFNDFFAVEQTKPAAQEEDSKTDLAPELEETDNEDTAVHDPDFDEVEE